MTKNDDLIFCTAKHDANGLYKPLQTQATRRFASFEWI